MKNRKSKSTLAALMVVLSGSAFAQPPQGWQNNGQPHGNGNGGGHTFYLPENSGFGSSNNVQRGYGNEQQQQPSKMSPEDRRTLRQQINEVGHDIYAAPKR